MWPEGNELSEGYVLEIKEGKKISTYWAFLMYQGTLHMFSRNEKGISYKFNFKFDLVILSPLFVPFFPTSLFPL